MKVDSVCGTCYDLHILRGGKIEQWMKSGEHYCQGDCACRGPHLMRIANVAHGDVSGESPKRADESPAYRELRIERDSLRRRLEASRDLLNARTRERNWWVNRAGTLAEKLESKHIVPTPGELELADLERDNKRYKEAYEYWYRRWSDTQVELNGTKSLLRKANRAYDKLHDEFETFKSDRGL